MKIVLNSFIIAFVLVVVLFIAAFAIHESIESETSNVKIISKIIKYQTEKNNNDVLRIDTSLMYKLSVRCKWMKIPNKSYSLIDYLDTNNIDSSFGSRYILAKEAGLEGYEGSKSENAKVLNYLKAKYSNLLAC